MPTVQYVNFSIEGDYITNISRQMMLEGNWRGALKILGSINQLNIDDQICILKGDKYLTGSNDISLIEDIRKEDIEFKKNITQYYGKIISFNNKFYEPYACVDSWCREDLPNKEQKYNQNSLQFTREFNPHLYQQIGKKVEHPYARSLHYADDSSNDFAIGIFNDDTTEKHVELKNLLGKVVLFKETKNDIPFFWEEIISQTPIDSLLKRPWLEKRGAAINYHQHNEEYFTFSNPDNITIEPKIKINDLTHPRYDDMSYDEKKQTYIKKLIKSIKEFADNDKEYGWKTLTDENDRTIKVPGRAFLHYALNSSICEIGIGANREALFNQLPKYKAISCSGLKTGSDNPYHTDCWLGADLDLKDAYDFETWQNQLFLQAAFDFQKEHLHYNFHLISRGGIEKLKGTTCTPFNYEEVPHGERILVLPHLGIEFENVALKCDAIIAEQGGPMAHLVTIGKECKKSFPIIRLENACVKFLVKLPITIDFINGKIEAQDKNLKI